MVIIVHGLFHTDTAILHHAMFKIIAHSPLMAEI